MTRITSHANVKIALTAHYSHNGAEHFDHYYCETVNMWRDAFTPDVAAQLIGLRTGDKVVLAENLLIPPFEPRLQFTVRSDQWQPPKDLHRYPAPRTGRWYPQGYLRAAPNIFPQSIKPLLVRSANEESIEIDCNHPLAGVPLQIEAEILEISSKNKERGGRCTDWFEELTQGGPGMQLLREGITPDYHEMDGRQRSDGSDDKIFYAQPRLIDHIDCQARQHLREVMRSQLKTGMKILDLMSSLQSHLPQGYFATGLGMNEKEMRANPHLHEFLVHDLNASPKLPFTDARFDCVCCHLSIEYLLEPEKLFHEIARVLTPGGSCVVSFSNRWFPPKVTTLWQILHEFERPRYIMEMMHGLFHSLTTTSFRNWPRPADDLYAHLYLLSDPLYVVTGKKVAHKPGSV